MFTAAFNDNRRIDAAGIRYGDLSAEGRERLEALLGTYIGRIRPGHAEIRYAEVEASLSETHFAWIGPFDDASPFYYRILSPVILRRVRSPVGHHLRQRHAIARPHPHGGAHPNGNDYGKDLLRQHYAQHDHSHPPTLTGRE